MSDFLFSADFALASILVLNALALGLAAWNAVGWPAPARADGAADCDCSILIPARNEEANIAGCLDSALAQGDAAEIVVCDDHSDDATAEIVRQYAREHAGVRLIQAEALPSGWCGKTFAAASLAARAEREWLLFLDADARLSPGAAAAMIQEAQKRGASLLSCWPRLEMRGIAEKTFLPMLNFVVFTLFPAPLSLRRMDPSLGLAHGACILARRSVYEALGGHALVRGELFEDTCLARAWRAAGQTSLCLDGQHLVRVRMYDSLGAIWRGFLKNFYPAFRRDASFWLFLGFHAGVFLAPFAAVLFARGAGQAFAAASALCVLAARSLQAWRFRYPWWSALAHPLAEALLLALGAASWWSFRRGRGAAWKGRLYRRSTNGIRHTNDPGGRPA
ncbi:MAG: 4,4'-diaponeurosporenoate glycosyltransferase [candidate division BRC1 bacterium ADurb.BinA364]|nr:MAG: 4,4'-diaponeurosporenoate glycosyltransferase [candidate division BRC1 bacterium ADurb.BinA364]